MKTLTALSLLAALLIIPPAFAAEQPAPSSVSPRGTEGPDTRHAEPVPHHHLDSRAKR